ncbi:hypothetical protein HOT39_gp83 [Escherichia phage LL5]|uniref:Uncharacterized protein n=1 Tax=Escherichia phage LL5 TaxID=2233992 RepID=A0A2Z4Q3D5_9CAUD|nr:hypothetical protein HOT39_gp83 [Escherichia phage LL5]AWY04385.1 hypothetical protein CPT_LL5_83 [Escherichia phage LL5]
MLANVAAYVFLSDLNSGTQTATKPMRKIVSLAAARYLMPLSGH